MKVKINCNPFRRCSWLLLALLLPAPGSASPLDLEVDIPYTLHKLDNGLTVIVHEDHKAPIVAVNLWYHVGSKNEKRGKTGFAHLFEHLMFNGSEHFNHDYFKALETVGATDLNGTTNWDRTNYFQNVPTSALDLVLWMESDRMGHLLGAIDQDKLDEQREVVKNEKRQGLNRPYGEAADLQYASIYPPNHPYSWTPIGSMEDLDAASLEDVREWFKTHYGAANTVVVIAGDVDTDEAVKKVEKYFGEIAPGAPSPRQDQWVYKLTGEHRQLAYDQVSQTMILKSWNIPGAGSREQVMLGLVGAVLSEGKSSRLYKRLVYDDQTVTSVNAYVVGGEIAGTFEIQAMVKPGADEAGVDRAISEELERFLQKGAKASELKRVKTSAVADFVRGAERIGGFGGKSDILASNYVYNGDPGYFRKQLQLLREATVTDLSASAREWLSDGMYHLEIQPLDKQLAGGEPKVDRTRGLPPTGKPPLARFDEFSRKTLDNGLTLLLATRDAIPVVHLSLSVDAGYASDQLSLPGVASLAMDMMDEGTRSRNSLEISDELASLGASLSTGSNLDTSFVSMSTLKTTLAPALDLFSDVVLNPSFPEAEFTRLVQQQMARIQSEKVNPRSMAIRVLPKLVYGENHPYGNPRTGTGTEKTLAQITLAELQNFRDTWFKPNHATLIVVGDITLAEVEPLVNRAFRNWQRSETPDKVIARVSPRRRSEIYVIDRPGSPQSLILGGQLAPPENNPDEISYTIMNAVLGGSFTSRINMNLREDKGWSYGARSGFLSARGQRTFYVLTSVQTNRTGDSMVEILSELNGFVGDRPATAEEVATHRTNRALSLSGRWETANSVLGSLSSMVQYGLSDDYYRQYGSRISEVTALDVRNAARKLIRPESMAWVIVGDLESIRSQLRAVGMNQVIEIDADGNEAGTLARAPGTPAGD